MQRLRVLFAEFDGLLFVGAIVLSLMGLVTMYSYVGENAYFERQMWWVGIALVACLIASVPDYRFLRNGHAVLYLYLAAVASLVLVLIFGEVVKGAQSRFDFGPIALQPSDPAKLILILVLAKYFSKRHVEIADIRHIIVSGLYAFLIFGLVFVQPDFGSALILFSIWFGMVLVSGISWKHVLFVFVLGALSFSVLWFFGFAEYQKDRIRTFIHPLADIQGTGYNAFQSMIAVGSGEMMGRGIGYGTQSKLQFLPEYETDFIFAAFAEEWGFVGVLAVFLLFGFLVWRILFRAYQAETNFERLVGAGVAILICTHFTVHIGMNIGLLPVTGTTVPFLSYGGSHLLTEFIALGMVIGMSRRRMRVRED